MPRAPAGAGELSLLRRVGEMLPRAPEGEEWVGDDAAVLRPPEGDLLLCIDGVVQGVHFDLGLVAVRGVGWRAMVASLSDVAAMAGRPWRAVASVVAPAGTDVEDLLSGVAEAADRYRCPLVGGDLSTGQALTVSIAVTGSSKKPVLRSGARPGDSVYVTGPLGGSAAGLRLLRSARGPSEEGGNPSGPIQRYLRPEARVEEGLAAAAGGARAMIDVSDGLALDLTRLAEASGVGLRLEEVPVAAGARPEDALGGGDDYELAFAAPDPAAVRAAFEERGLPEPVLVGSCTRDPTERLLQGRPLQPLGWEHRF
jgi:thiamine-monophosphate kinase